MSSIRKNGPITLILLVTLFIQVLSGCDRDPKLQPLARKGVILAFGDSLTRGTGADDGNSYPSILADLLDVHVVNAGVPGELSTTGLERLPKTLERYQPELVILCHGGNDLLQRRSQAILKQNLLAMVQLCHDSGAQVVLVGVPNPGLFLRSAEVYDEVAAEMEVPYLDDILPEILKDRALKSDAVHPNGNGYSRLAETLANQIRPALY